MTHASLFSGIGGFDLAAQWLGWENAFHCEINPFCQRVLKHYWPDAQSYDDITTADFSIWRGRINVLSGGFPCQPFSLAGQRKGAEDNRYLWPAMLRAIDAIRPDFVVGENVAGILSMVQPALHSEMVCNETAIQTQDFVLNNILEDLERIGYAVQAFVIPAASVGAPHRRDRIWIVAHAGGARCQTETGAAGGNDANKDRNRQKAERERLNEQHGAGLHRLLPDTEETECQRAVHTRKRRDGLANVCDGTAANADGIGFAREKHGQAQPGALAENGIRPDWSDWPTQPPVRGRNDGVPGGLVGITVPKHRNESIRGYGNAVVPQLVYDIFKSIQLTFETQA